MIVTLSFWLRSPRRPLGLDETCCIVDWRTYTTAKRSQCRGRIFSVYHCPSSRPWCRLIAVLPLRGCGAQLVLQQLAEQPQETLAIWGGQPHPQLDELAGPYGRGGRTEVDIHTLSLPRPEAGTCP